MANRTLLFGTLNINSRAWLAIRVHRKLNSGYVMDALSDLVILRGIPSCIRLDNGPEFVAKAVQDWMNAVCAKTVYLEPGQPLSADCSTIACRAMPGRTDIVKASMLGSGMRS